MLWLRVWIFRFYFGLALYDCVALVLLYCFSLPHVLSASLYLLVLVVVLRFGREIHLFVCLFVCLFV